MSALLPSSDSHSDKRLNALLIVAVLMSMFALVVALVAVPRILSTGDTAEALRASSDIAGCRASYRVQLVDDPSAVLQVASARLSQRTNEGLEAVARGDDELLLAIITTSPTLAELRAAVEKAARVVEAGTARYSELIGLSNDDPARFVRDCHRLLGEA